MKEFVLNNKIYGYIANYFCGGKGIVIAENEDDAKRKVYETYLKHGYKKNELDELEVWEITEDNFKNNFDVLEIWQ